MPLDNEDRHPAVGVCRPRGMAVTLLPRKRSKTTDRQAMYVLRIHDLKDRSFLDFDLQHVLRALGPRARTSVWQVGEETSFNEPIAATGDAADDLEILSEQGHRISGTDLLRLAENVHQVIWGEFRAYESAICDRPWVIVRAVDSAYYEVESDDIHVQDDIRRAFHDVR